MIEPPAQTAQNTIDATTGLVGFLAALGGYLQVINVVLATVIAVLTIVILIYRLKKERRESAK